MTIFDRSLGQADLWSDVTPTPLPISEASGEVDMFVRSLGQTDLWSYIPPISEALGQVDIFVRSSGQADLWSDVPHLSEDLGQVDIFMRCLCHADLWSDVSPTPGPRHLVAKCDTTAPFCQVALWSDVPPTMGRDILWPSVILLQVMLTCLFEGKSGGSSCSNSISMSGY